MLNITNIETFEITFFKVFRNRFINQHLFSNFNTIYDYDNIFGIENTYSKFSNAEAIIKDKIKGGHEIFKNKLNEYELVFKNIYGQTKENHLFYNRVFNNFKLKDIDFTDILQKIIEQLNLVALIEFINVFKTQHSTIKSFMDTYYLNNIQHFYKSYRSVKVLQNLIVNGLLNIKLIKELPIDYFNQSFSLKKLIKYHQLLNSLDIHNQNSSKIQDIINELNQVEINSFTHKQLKLKIRDIVINSLNNNQDDGSVNLKIMVQKYYKCFYINQNKPIQYYFYFKSQNKINQIIKQRNINQYEYYQDYLEIVLLNQNDKEIFLNSCVDYLKDNQVLDFYNYVSSQNETIFKKYYDGILLQGCPKLTNTLISSQLDIIGSIKTTKLFDYLFKFHQNKFFLQNNQNWKSINDMELLGHYELLMDSIGRKMYINFTKLDSIPYLKRSKSDDERNSVFWNSSSGIDKFFRIFKHNSYIKVGVKSMLSLNPLFMFFDFRACINNNQQESIIKLLSSGVFSTVNFCSLFFDYHLSGPHDFFYHYYYEKKMDKLLKWVFEGLSKSYLMKEINKSDGVYNEYVEIKTTHNNLIVLINKDHIVYYLSKAGLFDIAVEVLKSNYCLHRTISKYSLENLTSDALLQYINGIKSNPHKIIQALMYAAKSNYISIFKKLNFNDISSGISINSIESIYLESTNNNNIQLSNYLINYFNLQDK